MKGKPILFIAIILIHVFLLFNVQLAFGSQSALAGTILTVYLLVMASLAALFKITPQTPPGILGLASFMKGFLITAIGLYLVSFVYSSTIAGSISSVVAAASFGFLYAFVIAFDEEIIFRDLLPLRMKIGENLSQVIFGLFHASALSATLSMKVASGTLAPELFMPLLLLGFVVLTSLGLIWMQLRKRTDIYVSTGSHFAYNLYAYGVLFTLIGIGVA